MWVVGGEEADDGVVWEGEVVGCGVVGVVEGVEGWGGDEVGG